MNDECYEAIRSWNLYRHKDSSTMMLLDKDIVHKEAKIPEEKASPLSTKGKAVTAVGIISQSQY